MKKLILSACATMALAISCVAPGPVMLPTSGPLMRQVSRVVERHDAYVTADVTLDEQTRGEYLGQSQGARELMISMPDGVPANLLAPRLAPVLDRHDSYVERDLQLDILERDQYLATTSGLRSLLTEAVWSRP